MRERALLWALTLKMWSLAHALFMTGIPFYFVLWTWTDCEKSASLSRALIKTYALSLDRKVTTPSSHYFGGLFERAVRAVQIESHWLRAVERVPVDTVVSDPAVFPPPLPSKRSNKCDAVTSMSFLTVSYWPWKARGRHVTKRSGFTGFPTPEPPAKASLQLRILKPIRDWHSIASVQLLVKIALLHAAQLFKWTISSVHGMNDVRRWISTIVSRYRLD